MPSAAGGFEMATLLVLKGANQGQYFTLTGDKNTIGRNADCEVVINLPAVSREHAVIRRIQGKYYIEDGDGKGNYSRNGTLVNNQPVTARTPLRENDRIKICDNLFAFLEAGPRPPLPPDLRRPEPEPEEEEASSTVEATLSQSNKEILETQPAEVLKVLLGITADLTQTIQVDALLPKIVDKLFHVFKQADRGFIILCGDEPSQLIPVVIKTRRQHEETTARFSKSIVNKCLSSSRAFLSEDATSDKQIDLSQSIADCRIRSVMCVPLLARNDSKPFGVIQLDTDRSKKFNQDDLKFLLAVAGQAAIALENARLHEEQLSAARIQRDLDLAHHVQLSFLPKQLPELPGYEFYRHYEPALEVGGDYYDFIPISQKRLAVMLGDVAGKGVPAALLMAKISSDARFCMLTNEDPAVAVSNLNTLLNQSGLSDRFVTLAGILLDPVEHIVTLVSAGQVPPLVYRSATGSLEEAVPREVSGFPLGCVDGIQYESCKLQLESGDFLLTFTDGVTDAKNKDGIDFLKTGGLEKAVLQSPYNPQAVGRRLIEAVKRHAQGCQQHDDITVVCFGRT
jgi:serine phosphatase RsbU (regulator of sigma subunit)/pSer/pThr/pTyr-binding forkhead associated (FHA) protein